MKIKCPFHACRCREAMFREAIQEAIAEIEYWHKDMLTENERAHQRGNGWARVYDKLVNALKK